MSNWICLKLRRKLSNLKDFCWKGGLLCRRSFCGCFFYRCLPAITTPTSPPTQTFCFCYCLVWAITAGITVKITAGITADAVAVKCFSVFVSFWCVACLTLATTRLFHIHFCKPFYDEILRWRRLAPCSEWHLTASPCGIRFIITTLRRFWCCVFFYHLTHSFASTARTTSLFVILREAKNLVVAPTRECLIFPLF